MTNCPNCNESKDVVKMGRFGKDIKQRYGCNSCKEKGINPWTFYDNQNKIKYVCDDPNCGHDATRKGIIRGKQRLQCKRCKKTFFEKVEEPIDPVEAKLEEWRKEGKPVDLMELGMLVHVDDNEHVTEQNPTIDNEDVPINKEEFEKWKLKEEEEDKIKAKELSTLKNKKLELEKKYFGESEEDVI